MARMAISGMVGEAARAVQEPPLRLAGEPLHERTDLATALAEFHGTVVGTSPRAKQTIYDVDLAGPVAMIFGSEGRGLPEEALSMANQLVHIPMSGNVESLNVAAAAAICCFEKLRQTRLAVR